MSANKNPQSGGPGRRCRSTPALGPLGEINLGSKFGPTPAKATDEAASKQTIATDSTGRDLRDTHPPDATSSKQTSEAPTTPTPEFKTDPIIFASRSAIVSQHGLVSAAAAAKFMSATPASVRLEIKGFSDQVGEEDENQILSQQRADAVMAVLVGQDIARERLLAQGQGATKQFGAKQADGSAGDDYQRLRANRRVQLELLIDLG